MFVEQSGAIEDLLKAKVDVASFRVARTFSPYTGGFAQGAIDMDDAFLTGSLTDIGVLNWQTEESPNSGSLPSHGHAPELFNHSWQSDSWSAPVAQWSSSNEMYSVDGGEVSVGFASDDFEPLQYWGAAEPDGAGMNSMVDVLNDWDSNFFTELQRFSTDESLINEV